MYDDIFKTRQQFLDNCPCAYQILKFVELIKDTDARWYFHKGYAFYSERRFSVIFKSYAVPEYEDYILSIEALHSGDDYELRIIKKVDNLLNGSE